MDQLGSKVQGAACGLCGREIKDKAELKNGLLCHDICPEEGQRDIARAAAAAKRFPPPRRESAP